MVRAREIFQHSRLGTAPFIEMTYSLWLFCRNLAAELAGSGPPDLFFLSKEGFLLKDLFAIFCEHTPLPSPPRPHYLIASRKSTYPPSLAPLDHERFARLTRRYRDLSVSAFLASIGIEGDTAEVLRQRHDSHQDGKIRDFAQSPVLAALCRDTEFRDAYESCRSSQNALFREYLASFGASLDESGLHLVDVGWMGTIQDNISSALHDTVPVVGYYVGLRKEAATSPRNRKKGLLFSELPERSVFFDVYDENWQLFEMILGAPHGSATAYARRDGRVVAITRAVDDEMELYARNVRPLQLRIAEAFHEVCRRLASTELDAAVLNREIAKAHARMVYLPRKEELEVFGKTSHYQNFGLFEWTHFAVSPPSCRRRARMLLALIRNRPAKGELWPWPILALYNMGLLFWGLLYGAREYGRNFGMRAAASQVVRMVAMTRRSDGER
ncbi:MAG: hypothetical protein HYV63_07755 [Candidatus Schekmanbacteria bacterium]|nr:hypothetical protein [Candidatus Schekmanbacteria bacterium]